jgi:DNA-binding transcriptional LysR family regulator
MEIRQLEAFAAVYTAGSVTAGARLLDRSQPMVSRQIQDLENELGFTLFTRTRPMVTLTEQGRQLYDEVRHVLAGLQQLEIRSREIAQGEVHPLRLVSTYALGSTLVPAVVGVLEKEQPAFAHRMYIESMPPAAVVRAIEEAEADIGLVSLPVDLGRCQVECSGQAPCVLALPDWHPLASQETVDIDTLGEGTAIVLSNRSRMRYRMSTALLNTGTEGRARRHIETTSSVNAVMMVREGVGVALVDPFTAALMPMAGVTYRPINKYVPYLMGVITHRDRPLSDEIRRLIQAFWQFATTRVPHFVDSGTDGQPTAVDPAELANKAEDSVLDTD